MMNNPQKVLLMLMVFALANPSFLMPGMLALAAKKYYPPGYNPPASESDSNTQKPPQTIIVPRTQVIIKTEPAPPPQVIIKKVAVPAKPKDPLTVMLEERRFYEALRLVDQRIQKSPNDIGLKLTRAQILRDKENYDQSEAEYDTILSKTKDKSLQVRAYAGLGLTHMSQALQAKRLGDDNEFQAKQVAAETAFKHALAINPNNTQAWTGLAQLALSKERYTEADTAIKRALKHAPNDIRALMTQSHLLLEQKQPEEALPVIFKAKQLDSREPQVNLLLGRSYLDMERFDDAIIQLQQVLDKNPQHSDALKLLSKAYEGKLRPDDAELMLQKAISLNPADKEATASLLKIYDQRGEKERSLLVLKTLLKDQPGMLEYQKELLTRLLAENRVNEAFQQGTTFVEPILSGQTAPSPVTEELVSLFSQAAYAHGKGFIDRQRFLAAPVIKNLVAYYTTRLNTDPAALNARLNILLMDPLHSLTALPADYQAPAEQAATMAKIAFLTGNWPLHQASLQQVAGNQDSTPEALVNMASEFAVIGDYHGAQRLIEAAIRQKPGFAPATELATRISTDQRSAQEKLEIIEKLPRDIPRAHWEKTVEEALRLSSGNWELHALLAESLLKQRDYDLALMQQQLAIQYAPSEEERKRLLKKIQKTERKIGKSR